MQTEAFSSVPDEDPEVKPGVMVCMSLEKHNSSLPDYFLKCCSWARLKKVVAWLFRYRENLLNASKKKSKHDAPKYITLRELERAEELNYPTKPVKKTSRLYMLDPHVIDGLLCVGGRLRNASLPSETKNEIILPKEDHATKMIIYDYRNICGHSGREHVLALIREKFWILQGSSTVKGVLSKCVSCRRRQAPLCQQKMADLQESRVLTDKPPFTAVGVDYLVPFKSNVGVAS